MSKTFPSIPFSKGRADDASTRTDGHRIGQGHKDSHISVGSDHTTTIEHSQTEPKHKQVDPYYILVSQMDNNAICISAIMIGNTQITASFFGDTGAQCGQSWFESDNEMGSDYITPKCVWLDRNHEDVNAAAMSFHIRDMMPNKEKMEGYEDSNFDLVCKSSPRFSYWGNLLPDGIPPFFDPPLEYENGNGRDKDPARVLDDPAHPFHKGVFLSQGEEDPPSESRRRRRSRSRKRRLPHGANRDPSHLIVSDRPSQSARRLCESATSLGWDFVSTAERLFCDMEHKRLYPLCDGGDDGGGGGGEVRHGCFDLEGRTLRPALGARAEDAARLRFGRAYNSTAHWKPRAQKRAQISGSLLSWLRL